MEDTLPNRPMGPMREKHWDELDDPGRIERLRQVIKDQERLIRGMAEYLNLLIGHEHLDGKMVKQISPPNSESYGGFHYHKNRSDEWF